jgi:Flp pilus assembly protein TadD
LPLIGVWVVVAELRFGLASQRLAERMVAAGDSTELPDLPRRRSGRIERNAADAWFAERRAVVEGAPDDWRAWFRLAQAYDLAGDRRRAREALRTAIEKAD